VIQARRVMQIIDHSAASHHVPPFTLILGTWPRNHPQLLLVARANQKQTDE
jgi:hypothetical protein